MNKSRQRGRSIIGIGFTLLLVISMIPFGMNSASNAAKPIAITVNGNKVDYVKFEREQALLQARLQQQFGNLFEQLSKNMDLRSMTKDQLIDSELLLELVNKIGIATGDNQLRKGVFSYFGENFSPEFYGEYLARFGMSAKEFEDDLANKLKLVTINSIFEDFNFPSQKELTFQAEQELAKIDLEYLSFDPAKFVDQVPAPSEEKLKELYEKDSAKYELPAKIAYNYLVINPEDARKMISISEPEIETYFTENMGKYTSPEQVNLSVIKLNLPTDGNPENIAKIKVQADEIVNKIKSGKKFSEVAAQSSMDASKSKGGDLGWVSRNDISPELAEVYFSSYSMGLTKPIESNGSIYILDIKDYKEEVKKKLEDVKAEIKSELENQNLPAYLSEYANKEFEKLSASGKSLKEVFPQAADKSLDAEESKEIPGLDKLVTDLKDTKLNLNEVAGKFVITELKEYKPAYVPEFASIKDKILADHKVAESKNLALEAAKKAIEGKLVDYASQNKLTLTKITTSKDKPELFSASPKVMDEIWNDRASREPTEFDSKFYVWKVSNISKPEQKEIKEKADAIKSTLTNQNTGMMVRSIVNSLKKNADIKLDSALENNA